MVNDCKLHDIFENLNLLKDEIEPSYRQRVPANIRDLIISGSDMIPSQSPPY